MSKETKATAAAMALALDDDAQPKWGPFQINDCRRKSGKFSKGKVAAA